MLLSSPSPCPGQAAPRHRELGWVKQPLAVAVCSGQDRLLLLSTSPMQKKQHPWSRFAADLLQHASVPEPLLLLRCAGGGRRGGHEREMQQALDVTASSYIDLGMPGGGPGGTAPAPSLLCIACPCRRRRRAALAPKRLRRAGGSREVQEGGGRRTAALCSGFGAACASIRRRNFVGGKKKIRQRQGKGMERSRKRETSAVPQDQVGQVPHLE